MTARRQCAIVWWHETRAIAAISLDVLSYQHRFEGAETVIRGHCARVIAICGRFIEYTIDIIISFSHRYNNPCPLNIRFRTICCDFQLNPNQRT